MTTRTTRSLQLTDRGWAALAHMPMRTWDQVINQSKVGSCNPRELGPKK